MKSSIVKKKNKKVFQPFTLRITIENEREAIALWHRFNVGNTSIGSAKYRENYKKDLELIQTEDCHEAWETLDNELCEQGVR